MSGSGFRGRGFGPRCNRPQTPLSGFPGPHPNFNQLRRPPNHQNFNPNLGFNPNFRPVRPPGQDGWRDNGERFNRHSGNVPQFQGHNLGHQRHYYNGPGNYHGGFRPVRFPGPRGRGPIRDSGGCSRDTSRESIRERERQHRYSRDGENRNLFENFQEPLLGSEEERQQKISKTVNKLKQTLSSFTEEDNTNFWEDNFSPSSSGLEKPSTSQKGIPELRHEPPELDLTFHDFKVIGRVDLDSSLKSDSSTPANERGNTVFNGSGDTPKNTTQGPRDDDPFGGEDCLYLDDPQEEAFIAQLDTRIINCDTNFPKPSTSRTNSICVINNHVQLVETNQSEEFTVKEKIISDFQIEERSDLSCGNNSNLKFDIDPSFAANVTDSVQNELANFKNGSVFELSIDSNFGEPTDVTETTPVSFEAETAIVDEQIPGGADLQDSDNQFEKSEHIHQEIPLQNDFQEKEFSSDSSHSNHVQLFTAFESAEPPSEILQEESHHSNTSFEQQEAVTKHNIEVEPSSNLLQNAREVKNLQSIFDQKQIQNQNQIFNSAEALPKLSQQESNLFYQKVDQMEGNFLQSKQDSFIITKDNRPNQLKNSECCETNKQLKDKDFEKVTTQKEESEHACKESQLQCGEEPQHSNSLCDRLCEKKDSLVPQEPLQPPPMFELTELMQQYSSPNASESSKSDKNSLQPPPIFDPMETFPNLLQECEKQSNASFHSHLQEEPLQPPPMFELEEPPIFLQNCDNNKASEDFKELRKLDHREESQHINSSFDQQHSQKKILQPPPVFNPRAPPPTVSIIKEDRIFKPPSFEEVIQPPKVFDPRLSSKQRMNFVSSSGRDIAPPNWSGGITDFNMPSNFVPPMHVPPISQPARFIPSVGYNIPTVIPPLAPTIPIDFPPPLPQDNQAPPPLPVDPPHVPESLAMLSMEDELEEMQEAMEFAKQLMNMSESNGEVKYGDLEMSRMREKKTRKSKEDKHKEQKGKDSKKEEKRKREEKYVEYGPAPLSDMVPEKRERAYECQQNMLPPEIFEDIQLPETEEDGAFTDDQIRPKVVFNLNKIKRICKADEWQQQQAEESEDAKTKKKKTLKDKLEKGEASNSAEVAENYEDKTDDEKRRRRRRSKDKKEEVSSRTIRDERPSTSFSVNEEQLSTTPVRNDEKQDSYKKGKKQDIIKQELWRNRVINQFLKMSKNDINNMINNTGLRRFDMAMKQLVKERKTSLSQEMRNTEEEKVRDYDGDQFMTQLSAMLDPGVRESVDITNLPTEFIQHLSAVLHLDPMPGVEEAGGEMEIMNSDDFLQQMVMTNKVQRTQERDISEEDFVHLPKQSSLTLVQPIIDKKRSKHSEKKDVYIPRFKDPVGQDEFHGQVLLSHLSKDDIKSSRGRENGEMAFRNSVREIQTLREAQFQEIPFRDTPIREQQAREQFIREQREQELKEQQIQEQQVIEEQEAKTRDAKARETKGLKESEFREAAIREAEIKELKKKQAQLKAQLAKEMLDSVSTSLDSVSPPHITSVIDDIFKQGISKGKSERNESRFKPNRSEVVTKPLGKYPTLGTMERTLDDIFSAGIAKAKALSKPAVEAPLEQQQLWTRKKRENVDTFRNLTKEEWEAKHGRSMSDSFEKEFNILMSRRPEIEMSHSKSKEVNEWTQKKIYQWDETPLPERVDDESAERILVRQKEHLEDGELIESGSDSDNDSSTSSTSSSESASSENIAPDVTKLLKVIKEREKVAKKKSFNEAIRDEIAADIEKRKREKERHKERKSRKRKKREKKGKKKKKMKKHKKKAKRNSLTGSEKDIPEKLLTEDEIKKEVKIEPISPEEKESTIDVQNKDVSQAIRNRTGRNSPTKVNIDYGQNAHLMKTKAQLKQMPESTAILSEPSTQTSSPTADACALRTDAGTQIQTNSVIEAKGVCHKSEVENKKMQKERKVEHLEGETTITGILEITQGEEEKIEEIHNDIKPTKSLTAELKYAEVKMSEAKIAEAKFTETNIIETKEVETKEVETKDSNTKVAEESMKKHEDSEILTEKNISNEKSVKGHSATDGEKKPKRIDIQAYKARTLERKKKEQEKLKELSQNPISLTTDLLNIPLAAKARILQCSTESQKVNENIIPVKSNLIICEPKAIDIKKPTELKSRKFHDESKHSNVLRDPRLTSKVVQDKLEIDQKKTLVDKLDPNENEVKDEDENKFKFIKSEGGKELKLKNKPKSSKKIKNQSTPLVVIEQKIESPARRSSISSESDYSQGSSHSKTSKTVEVSKGKQEKYESTVMKSKTDVKTVKVDTKLETFRKENLIKYDEDFKGKIFKDKQVFKEKTNLETKILKDKTKLVTREKSSKSDEKLQETDNDSKEREKSVYKPVRKLKIYGKSSKTEVIEKNPISDELPDTVPSEEITKYYAMEIENYPNILQDLIEDDVCPVKEVFFGNMSLKEDDISDMKDTFENDVEQKNKQLGMEEINPMENIIFDSVVLDTDLEQSNVAYSEINSCGLSPKTDEIFDQTDHEKPELFHFGIDDGDQNLGLSSVDLAPILAEEELVSPLENVEKLNNDTKFPNKSLVEQLSECESDDFLIRDNLRIEIAETNFSNKIPEQTVQDLFEPNISKVENIFEKCNLQNSEFVNVFHTNFENKFKNPATEVISSLSDHVGSTESRETSDLIHKTKESLHVNLIDLQEKPSSDCESSTKIVIQVGEKCADLFTSDACYKKDETERVINDDNKESQSDILIPLEDKFVTTEPEISVPDTNCIAIPRDSQLSLVTDASVSSVDNPQRVFQEHSYTNEPASIVEVKLQNKPKKISEIVLQTGFTLVRLEKNSFEQSIISEESLDEKLLAEKSKPEIAISEKEELENLELLTSNQKNEEEKVQASRTLSSEDLNFEVRFDSLKADSENSKEVTDVVMGVRHLNQQGLDKVLHSVKHKGKVKKKKEKKVKEEVKETLKQTMRPVTTQSLMARMKEIDDEIQKLMLEKLKLYQMMGNMEQNTASMSEIPVNVSNVCSRENLGDLDELKSEVARKQKKVSTPEDDEVAFFSKEHNSKGQKENIQNKEILQTKEKSQSKFKRAAILSEDEEIARISEKKSRKLSKADRSQLKISKNRVLDSSSDDEEMDKISTDKKKKLTRTNLHSFIKKTLDSDTNNMESTSLNKLKKLTERSQSRMKKGVVIHAEKEIVNRKILSKHKLKTMSSSEDETDQEEKKIEERNMAKRSKSVMKATSKSSSEDEAEQQKKFVRKRPKSVMRIFSGNKSSDDDETKAKKRTEMKRPKSVMRLTSKVTESSDVTSGDEEVAMLNLNSKKNRIKTHKIETEAMKVRPKSAMKPSTFKLIPSSEDEDFKKIEKTRSLKNVEKSRKRPKSVMMKSSSKNDESDNEPVKKKKMKEFPVLNTAQKIFVKIKGKHEREKSRKKESPEKKEIQEREKKVQIMDNKCEDEKGDKKGKVGLAFVLANKVDDSSKKKIDISAETKKNEKGEKTKKTNSTSLKKERKDEVLDKRHSRVKALDSALIYSDESTVEALEPVKDNKLKKSSTGLALLEQSFRKEMAEARKAKAEERKKLKIQTRTGTLEKEEHLQNSTSILVINHKDKNTVMQKATDQKEQVGETSFVVPENIYQMDKAQESQTNFHTLDDIPGPQDQTPCKGFDVSENQKRDEKAESPSHILETSQNSDKVREISKNLFSEMNEEESLNQEVQRINSGLEEKTTEAVTISKNIKILLQEPKYLDNQSQETVENKKVNNLLETVNQTSQSNFKELLDKDSSRSALMSPISDDSTLSGDFCRKRKKPTRRISKTEKSQPTRRSSRHQESEDEPEKKSRNSSRQRRESQTPIPDFEPPKKKKISEKYLYSQIKDLLKLEIRTRRKDKKKRKLSREEMKKCKVKLVDLKYTYMRTDLPQGVLKRLGLSKINIPSKGYQTQFEDSSLLHKEIMKVQVIRRFSIEESSSTSDGIKNSETTMYIFKLDQGNKLEAVKLSSVFEEESKNEKGSKDKKSRIEEVRSNESEEKLVEENSEEEKGESIAKEVEKFKEKGEEKSIAKEKEKSIEEERSQSVISGNELMQVERENPSTEVNVQEKGLIAENYVSEINGPSSEVIQSEFELQNKDKKETQQSVNPAESDRETEKIEIPKFQYTVHKGPILDIKVESEVEN